MKQRVNISLDETVAERLKRLAEGSHRSVSQWVTDKVLESDKGSKNGSKSVNEIPRKGE